MSNHTTPKTTHRTATRRTLLGGGLALALSAGGGTAWALNRYVIDHVEVADATAYEAAQAAATGTTATTASVSTGGAVSGQTYTSDLVDIAISKHTSGSGSSTVTWFVADVQAKDATVIRSAFAQNAFGTNIIANPSVIAAQANAVFAINGDYYGFRDTGMVIRNGVIYRDAGARQGLALYRDGSVKLYDETATSAKALVDAGVWNTLSFGPGIVSGGAIVAGIDSVEVDTNVGNHSIQGNQPRTGIGAIADNHLVFVVADGRSSGYSKGVTMTEFAQLFVDLGAQVAYNLDGGGSSTMLFNGALVNNPLGKGQERGTSDILYIGA